MKSKDFDGMNCSIATVMGALGDRWGIMIMRDILLGLQRYDQLKQASPITHATLSDRLKNLEMQGLIEKRLYQQRPERYEYIATEKGQDVALVMLAMLQIGDKWKLQHSERPPLNFIHCDTGNPVQLQVVDAETENKLHFAQVNAVAGAGADDLVLWRLEQAKLYKDVS